VTRERAGPEGFSDDFIGFAVIQLPEEFSSDASEPFASSPRSSGFLWFGSFRTFGVISGLGAISKMRFSISRMDFPQAHAMSSP
jgi:hypothetical protein